MYDDETSFAHSRRKAEYSLIVTGIAEIRNLIHRTNYACHSNNSIKYVEKLTSTAQMENK